jgi:hypothetical protein
VFICEEVVSKEFSCFVADMFGVLVAGLAFSDSRISKWMTFKDRDHLSAQDKNRLVVSACGSSTACCCQT